MVGQMVAQTRGFEALGVSSLAMDTNTQGVQNQPDRPLPTLLVGGMRGPPPGLTDSDVPVKGQRQKGFDTRCLDGQQREALMELHQQLLVGTSAGQNQFSSKPSFSAPSARATPNHHPAEHPSPGMTGTGASVAPLSLADALGLGGEQPSPVVPPNISSSWEHVQAMRVPTPRASIDRPPIPSTGAASWLDDITMPPTSSAGSDCGAATLAEESDEVDAFIFAFTLRVAGGAELGLDLSPSGSASGQFAPFLRVNRVLSSGAVEAWNRQCGSSGAPEKVLRIGDKLVRVNKAHDAEAMLHECATARMLRLLVVRTPAVAPNAAPRKVAPKFTTSTAPFTAPRSLNAAEAAKVWQL